MVIGGAAINHSLDQTELGKWTALGKRRGAEKGLVSQIAEALKPVTLAAQITCLQGHGIGELPLEIELELFNVRRLAVVIMDQRQRLVDADEGRRGTAGIISNGQNG